MNPGDDALEAFNDHIDQLADEAGVELDDADRQRIFGLSIAGGFSPDSTVQAFGELVDDDYDDEFESDDDELGPGAQRLVSDFEFDVERIESERGRPLSDHERDALISPTVDQAARHGQIDVAGSLEEYQAQFKDDTSRSKFYAERLAPEPVEVEDRQYDLSVDSDRHQFMQARLNGAEFEDAE